jgi:hypothetical protein
MVVADLHIKRVAVSPDETDTILSVDADAVLTRAITSQCLEPKTRSFQVTQRACLIEKQEAPQCDALEALKAANALLTEQAARFSVGKAPYQTTLKYITLIILRQAY